MSQSIQPQVRTIDGLSIRYADLLLRAHLESVALPGEIRAPVAEAIVRHPRLHRRRPGCH